MMVQAWYSGKPSCVGRFPRDYVIGRNCQAHKADCSTGEAEIHMLQRCTKGNKAQASGLVKMSQRESMECFQCREKPDMN